VGNLVRSISVLLVVVVVLSLSGCAFFRGGGDEFIRNAAVAARELAQSRGATAAETAAAEQVARDLAVARLSELAVDEQRKVVKAACTVKDISDVVAAEDLGDAAEKAVVNFGGKATLRNRVVGLAEELNDAESAGDAAGKAAVAGLCEVA
jgi:hypothetical protein